MFVYMYMSRQVWDLRQTQLMYSLAGHMDTVTGLRVSPNGNYLLSNSMDDTGEPASSRHASPSVVSEIFKKMLFKLMLQPSLPDILCLSGCLYITVFSLLFPIVLEVRTTLASPL